MKARIQKWGNSLAVRIPKNLADETGLVDDSLVEINLVNGEIHIHPIHHYELDDLLAQISDENKHEEIDTGESQGTEAW
jgi:antitoxin MazE